MYSIQPFGVLPQQPSHGEEVGVSILQLGSRDMREVEWLALTQTGFWKHGYPSPALNPQAGGCSASLGADAKRALMCFAQGRGLFLACSVCPHIRVVAHAAEVLL